MLYTNEFADNPLSRTLGHVPAGMHDLLNGNTHATLMQVAATLEEIRRTQAQHGEMLATIERSLRNMRRRS
jgi:phosphopantothenoylcysteine synthetase/decarboxylase